MVIAAVYKELGTWDNPVLSLTVKADYLCTQLHSGCWLLWH